MLLSPPNGSESRILLHCCCAPCSGAILECLVQNGFKPGIFFSNSNITPREEYEHRKADIVRYAAKFSLEVIDDDYDHDAWREAAKGLETAPERGARCLECFRFRLRRASAYAAGHGYDTLTTTLASSRWKDLGQVNEAGEWACRQVEGVRWWGENWRKGGLQQRRSEVIAEQNFYNQTFCGCEFSHRKSCLIMGIINLTPDSFWTPSRASASEIADRIGRMREEGADIIDLGAVSTRPGAEDVDLETEWARLEPALRAVKSGIQISIDTTRAEIIRRAADTAGRIIVNDISAGEDDPEMLQTAAALKLKYIAMHKRGNPRTMDSLTDYGPDGVSAAVIRYFEEFSKKADSAGIRDWILDPGFGFAKTDAQNVELLENLGEFKRFGKKILIGIADKRFTKGDNSTCHLTALRGGASILRVHDIAAAVRDIEAFEKGAE